MKALSIRQPWAWLITRPDLVSAEARAAAVAAGLVKDIENRTRRTNFRGRFLVVASKGMTWDEYTDCVAFAGARGVDLPPFNDLARGGIVGAVELVDCLPFSPSPWYMGYVALVLRNAVPLPFTPVKGQLGFYDVPFTESELLEIDTP